MSTENPAEPATTTIHEHGYILTITRPGGEEDLVYTSATSPEVACEQGFRAAPDAIAITATPEFG
jgi:hypothetical protein